MAATRIDPWEGLELRKYYRVMTRRGEIHIAMWVVDGWTVNGRLYTDYTRFVPTRDEEGEPIVVSDADAEADVHEWGWDE